MASASRNLQGIASILLAQALLVGSDVFIKLASTSMPATQIMALRGPIAIALILGIVAATGGTRHLARIANPRVILRAGLEAVIALLFMIALAHLSLGDITAIVQSTPIVLTALSILLLGERAGLAEWFVVIAGFFGVLLVAQPSASPQTFYAGLAFAVAVLIAFRDILTKSLHEAIPTSVIALATTVCVCLLGWLSFPLQGAFTPEWTAMTPTLWLYVTGTAVLVAVASIFMIRAFRGVDLAVVSPFRYIVVVWALLAGNLIWNDKPNLTAVLGVVLIVSSGFILMRREWRKSTGAARALAETLDQP
jgi:drug/metabolite transporter (DMT)-like permease